MKCKEDQLRRCLVGWFGKGSDLLPDFFSVKSVVTNLWSFKGGVKISVFGVALLLFDFVDSTKVERVLARGSRKLEEKVLHRGWVLG